MSWLDFLCKIYFRYAAEVELSGARTARKSRSCSSRDFRRVTQHFNFNFKFSCNYFIICSSEYCKYQRPPGLRVWTRTSRFSRPCVLCSCFPPRGLPENTCVVQVTHRWRGKSLDTDTVKRWGLFQISSFRGHFGDKSLRYCAGFFFNQSRWRAPAIAGQVLPPPRSLPTCWRSESMAHSSALNRPCSQ